MQIMWIPATEYKVCYLAGNIIVVITTNDAED